MGKTWWSSFT